jgi:hypothetical protein
MSALNCASPFVASAVGGADANKRPNAKKAP